MLYGKLVSASACNNAKQRTSVPAHSAPPLRPLFAVLSLVTEGDPQMERKKTGWILLGLSLGMLIPVLMFPNYFYSLSGIPTAGDIGAVAWALSGLIAAGYIMYTFWAVPFVRSMQSELSALKAIGIVAAFASGLLEETVFRKMLMDWLGGQGAGAITQIAVSGFIFGITHSAWVALKGEIKIVLPVVISTAALGAALAALYIVSGRNVLPCIAAHIAINLVIEPWLMLAAVSGKWRR